MIPIFTKSIDSLERADLDYLLDQGYPEGSQVEYKRDLPHKRGGTDPWYQGNAQIEDYARNQILAEVVAFANSYGGHLLLGIEESASRPPIAQAIKPLPRCADLAEKLRLQARDSIEPKLPAFHTRGLITEPDGSGVVVIRIPRSFSAPHRLAQTLECYYRRADRSEKLTMREIQELTLSRARETQLVDQRFTDRSALFRAKVRNTAQALERPLPVNAIRVTLVPLAPDIYTGRLLNHPTIRPLYGTQEAKLGQRKLILTVPPLSPQPRPILRGIQFKDESSGMVLQQEILENGLVDYWLLDVVYERHHDALNPEYLMGVAVNAILTANRVRQEAGTPEAEYGIEVEVYRHPDSEITLARYESFSHVRPAGKLPNPSVFPRLSFLGRTEIPTVLSILDRDLWNSAGIEPSADLEVTIPEALLE